MWSLTFSGERTPPGRSRGRGDARRPFLDDEAFRAGYEQHAPAILRFAHARVGWPAAEEVLASTFEAAWKARAKYTDTTGDGLEAWLIGIAAHVVRRFRRAERRWLDMCADSFAQEQDRPVEDAERRIDERLDAGARARRLASALGHIPRREREVLLLHVVEELGYEQIAQLLDLPIGTVRSRISRGRARLVERMGGSDD